MKWLTHTLYRLPVDAKIADCFIHFTNYIIKCVRDWLFWATFGAALQWQMTAQSVTRGGERLTAYKDGIRADWLLFVPCIANIRTVWWIKHQSPRRSMPLECPNCFALFFIQYYASGIHPMLLFSAYILHVSLCSCFAFLTPLPFGFIT